MWTMKAAVETAYDGSFAAWHINEHIIVCLNKILLTLYFPIANKS